jgi:hypothetical protein
MQAKPWHTHARLDLSRHYSPCAHLISQLAILDIDTVGLGNLDKASIERREKQFDINVCLPKNSTKSSSLDFTM